MRRSDPSPASCRARLLAATTNDQLTTMYRLIAHTGLRRGEAVALRWTEVDLAAGSLSVNRQYVDVALAGSRPPAVAALLRIKSGNESPALTAAFAQAAPEIDARRDRGVLLGHSPPIIPRPRHDHCHCQRQPKVDPWRLCATPPRAWRQPAG